jgi:hypothetical protein
MLRESEIIIRSKIDQRPASAADAGSVDLVERLQSPIQRSLLQIRDDLFVRTGFQWVRLNLANQIINSRKRSQRGGAATKSWWNAVGLGKSGV